MDFHLAFALLCSVSLRPSNSQGAQEEDTISVTGPDTFVTNGIKELTLTCEQNISASVLYGWVFPGDNSRDCKSRPTKNVCNFRPRLDDDMKNVTCATTNLATETILKANYTLHLFYPPPSLPLINVAPSKTEPLTQGDVITCIVTGGRPRVTNVTFHCQHPDHADRKDDVSDDGTTVSSSITVDTSQATGGSMTCTCSAHWEQEPGLYRDITHKEFKLERPDAKLSLGAVTGIVVGVFILTVLLVVLCAMKGVKKKKSGEQNDQHCRVRPATVEYQNSDVFSRINTQHQPRQQTKERRQQQPRVVEPQPQNANVYQDMTGTHTHNNEGNTYDVLQRDQQDDGRIYTELITSPRADNNTYNELVNSEFGTDDYEIPQESSRSVGKHESRTSSPCDDDHNNIGDQKPFMST
ncbi:uncharacterized protein [Littorina saxatilis]|uniref:uncharacterized protein n=1 Tax=Littorina saxatilis TaxID=31220 RepID=UPI0038B6245D